MAVFQSNDGYLTFSIQASKENQDMFLLPIKDYIELLNSEELANSLLNKVGLVTTPEILGSFVEINPDKFSIIPGLEFNPLIYRGQNKDYDFLPSAYRYELSSGEERVRHSIDWIKKHEFLNLFKILPYYNRIQNFSVLNLKYEFDLEAVANNYNYVSNYIDFTRNLMTAYFFAYTYIDYETGKFMPIEDFETYNPVIYVGNLAKIYEKYPKAMQNIGIQALLRSKVQESISLDISNSSDIKSIFKKIELPKNIASAKNVYTMFRGGELLFPGDYLSRCAIQVRTYKTLHGGLINQYCAETSTDRRWLIGELKNKGYEIIDKPWEIPEQARYLVNREIDELIIPYMNNAISFRGCKKAQPVNANV